MKKGVIIAVCVGIAAALGFFAQRLLPDGDGVVAAAAPEAASSALPEPTAPPSETPATPPPPVVPEVLPQFELADRDGKKRKLGDWAGQPLVVNYWATWCGPCRREIPLLNELRAERSKQKVEIIGIAVDFRDDVLKYAAETTISYPLLIGEEDGLAAVKAMGVEQAAFPFTIFADSKQRILALKVGELHRDEAELILDLIGEVDAGKLAPEAARERITAGLKDIATKRAAAKTAGA
jgi:thiol-disulfide isomerase/thioredoxin